MTVINSKNIFTVQRPSQRLQTAIILLSILANLKLCQYYFFIILLRHAINIINILNVWPVGLLLQLCYIMKKV